jgi:hypothetical protein
MPLPIPRPSSGSLFAPKINTTIARMISSSGNPILPMMGELYHADPGRERLLNKHVRTP